MGESTGLTFAWLLFTDACTCSPQAVHFDSKLQRTAFIEMQAWPEHRGWSCHDRWYRTLHTRETVASPTVLH